MDGYTQLVRFDHVIALCARSPKLLIVYLYIYTKRAHTSLYIFRYMFFSLLLRAGGTH